MTKDLVASIAAERGYSNTAMEAALETCARQTGLHHPAGKFDSAGRFYLSEKCACCDGIRQPSRAFPMSQNKHGRSAEHVANLFEVPALQVKRLIKALKKAGPCNSGHERMEQFAEIEKILKKVS